MAADRNDAGIVWMVLMALDLVLGVEMREVMPIALFAFSFGAAMVAMLAMIALDVNVRRPAHVEVYRRQHLKRHEEREKPDDRGTHEDVMLP